ncbi:hypothetical protein Tco_0246105 [Tanacetum coccineum]
MMASFFQINTASTSGLGSLPSNTVANPRGELKAITTRSGLILDGPSVPMPPPFINPEEDERAEETLTDTGLAEYTIKVPPPLVQKAKPTSLKNYVMHKRDPLHLNSLLKNFYPFKISKKLLELVNTPLNKNCSAVILKKLPEKLGDPGKFLIPYGFSELKCKALADLDASAYNLEAHSMHLIDVHGEEMILRDGDERLILNMRHDTSSYSNKTKKESINMIDIYNVSHEAYLEDLLLNEDECECDVPDCDDSQTTNFSTFSNPLFNDSTFTDDESIHEEVIHEISFKTYSNPLLDLDEEIISSEFNPIHNEDLDFTPKNDRFDTESYLLESLLNHDTLMASSPKIDSLFDKFADELIKIPPRIVNRDHEEYISLLERLLYDNSSPRPPKDFHTNPNTIIESLPTFPIPVKDSDSLSDDYDSEGDDNSTSLPEFESFHVDYPDSGDSTIDVVKDIPIDVPNILPTHPTIHMDFDFIPTHNDLGSNLDVSSPFGDGNKIYDPGICIEVKSTRFIATHSPVIDTLLPFSSENEDKVFNHDVLASKEKSPPSSSHQGFKASKLFHHKSPMLIHGENIPILDIPSLHFYPP